MEDRRFVAELIDIFRYYPCLWDPRCPQFGDKSKMLAAFGVVIKKLKTVDPACAGVHQACARYRELRDHSFGNYHIYDTVLKYLTALDGSCSNPAQYGVEQRDDVFEDVGSEDYKSLQHKAYTYLKELFPLLKEVYPHLWTAANKDCC